MCFTALKKIPTALRMSINLLNTTFKNVLCTKLT